MKTLIMSVFLSLLLIAGVSCRKEEDRAEIEKKLIEDYIAQNELNAMSTPSGLYYVIFEPGTSQRPTSTSVVTVHYTGRLLNGTVFDSTHDFGQPIEISLSQVIAGWREGLQLFGRGGEGQLIIPSRLGYGSAALSGIPANSVLIFDIHLIDFF
ncbi:MAG TPA: FKBP-type peptidyl-prolyl cis-trans isomerase [Bacteroidales bacterium]|nr:FKBP-type peptidyl-prolyl cis-trans isomerase [Bacteroidales bacterium]